MKAVIQRVLQASVTIENERKSSIGAGLLVLLGISQTDTEADVEWLCKKIINLRIFADVEGKMNLSLLETGGELLLVSQFTLLGDNKKGNRPSFIEAARPEQAIPLYEKMIRRLSQELGKPVQTGTFGADMQVSLINDGPVTIIMDSLLKQ